MVYTSLSVNINKVATIRNARGGNHPNVLQFALDCYKYGAEGITVHPRPDERHIRYQDVLDLALHFPKDDCEFNIEGFPSSDFLELVLKAKPNQCTLVPDPPGVLTSNSGWNTKKDFDLLKNTINLLHQNHIRVSLFMDTDIEFIKIAKELGAERIEFYTGYYAEDFEANKEKAILRYKEAYHYAVSIGLKINAGHDLNLSNLSYLKEQMPELKEVSIGHALISDCLYFGLENVIPMYKKQLNN
jgi:pyridoxine 5-phosphate synthase